MVAPGEELAAGACKSVGVVLRDEGVLEDIQTFHGSVNAPSL